MVRGECKEMTRCPHARAGSQDRDGCARVRDKFGIHHTPPTPPAGRTPAPCCEAEATCCVTITHIASLPDQVATPHRILQWQTQVPISAYTIIGPVCQGNPSSCGPFWTRNITSINNPPQGSTTPNSHFAHLYRFRPAKLGSHRKRTVLFGMTPCCGRTLSWGIRRAATSPRAPSCSRRTDSSRNARCRDPAATGRPQPGGSDTCRWAVSPSPARRRCRRPAAWACRPAASC
jgi:hypothetical protein